jgi:hypothetical protein
MSTAGELRKERDPSRARCIRRPVPYPRSKPQARAHTPVGAGEGGGRRLEGHQGLRVCWHQRRKGQESTPWA